MERGTGIGKGSGKSTIRKTKPRKVTSKNVTDNCDVSDEEPPAQQQPGSKRKGTKKRKVRITWSLCEYVGSWNCSLEFTFMERKSI